MKNFTVGSEKVLDSNGDPEEKISSGRILFSVDFDIF